MPMPTLAALDIGSNAMRLAIASVDAERHITLLDVLREPVRLGQDVFTTGVIAERTIEVACEALLRFRQAIDGHGVKHVRAVATSAMRDAVNREIFLDRVQQSADLDITIIGPEEEARLIHLAVSGRVDLHNRFAVLVDIGGGSTEITLAADGEILSTASYRMGSVRLLRTLGERSGDERQVQQLIQEYVDATQRRISREIGDRKIDLCIGTGGNLESLGDLRKQLLGADRDTVVPAAELDALVTKLTSLSYQERVQQLKLRPDRADVIVPAALIIQKILRITRADELLVPRVGLKDGLLLDIVEELYGDRKTLRRDQIMASALQIGRKYQFDEPHALTVSRCAGQLFDRTRDLHRLGPEHRLFLEVAALLHDIGGFIGAADHHKHTQYLLMATPMIGLTRDQVTVIANIARYHRKSMPKQQHDAYRALSPKERVVVSKLAALLRLADAMDNEHASKVHTFETEYHKPRFKLRLFGDGDLLLEKWALAKKADMFEEVYGVKLVVAE
jgi:exopolyphosphatase / guanosine-5'-triphosphate,3'-diphosphate pyrophosphatase